MSLGALVLAAGKSTRIAGLAGGLPKPLLRFGGKALIERNLEWLASQGVRSVWINLHYRPEAIRSVLGAGERYGLEIRYSHEEEILGTAGAWRSLRDEWRGTSLVVYGDNVLRFDLGRSLAAHRETGAAATIALFDPTRHANTGIAGGHAVVDEDGRIIEFREGAPPRPGRREYVNAGAYLLEESVLAFVSPGFQDFGRDVFPLLVGSGRVFGHLLEDGGFCLGLDTPESFAAAQRLLEAGKVRLS